MLSWFPVLSGCLQNTTCLSGHSILIGRSCCLVMVIDLQLLPTSFFCPASLTVLRISTRSIAHLSHAVSMSASLSARPIRTVHKAMANY